MVVEEVDIHLDVVYYSALYPFDYYISKEMKRDMRKMVWLLLLMLYYLLVCSHSFVVIDVVVIG